MIRRIITLLFLFFCLNIIILRNKKTTIPVFNYLDDNSEYYAIYNISFNNININSNNFMDYFIDFKMKIMGIYPKINPIYENKIKDYVQYYSFNNKSIESNLSNFVNYYTNILSKNGLNNELEKIHFTGIKISKVKVYASLDEIKKIKSIYKNLTYD